MNICILAAGAGGMYCGSCLRDSTLATALQRLGHEAVLIPLYTPLRTDQPNASVGKVFYGGINVYLQYAFGLFRRTPRFLDWLLDRPWLLKWAGQRGAQTSPASLGPFVLSILAGDHGPQIKELRRLIEFLREHGRPDVVSLPSALFIGMARLIGAELSAPVVCELTGEDIFLDAMNEPYRTRARELICQQTRYVSRFVATSEYYAQRMARYLRVPPQSIDVAHPGVGADVLAAAPGHGVCQRPTVAYLARLCPEKGLDRLIEAALLLRQKEGMEKLHVRAAGYLPPGQRDWLDELHRRAAQAGLDFACAGEVDFAGKLRHLDECDVVCVPAAYAESKGIYVLEALARGRPVVLPDHGAFTELVGRTGGGVLCRPGDPQDLAAALHGLLRDPARRRELGAAGHAAVRGGFTDHHMAQRMLEVYWRAAMNAPPGAAVPQCGPAASAG